MKKSIQSENLIVVTAIAIAISLLASACGSGNVKTLKAKTGLKTFSDKTTVPVDEQNEVEVTQNTTAQEEAIIDLLNKDRNPNIPVEAKAVQELVSRIEYVQYADQDSSSTSSTVTVRFSQNNKEYLVKFSNGVKNAEGTIVEFAKPTIAKNVTENADAAVELSARVFKVKEGDSLVRVVLTEKKTEVSIIVKLGQALAQVTSKDDFILKMKDANIFTRISQVYVGDAKVESKANRIVLNVIDSNSNTSHYSFISKLNLQSNNSALTFNSVSEELSKSLTADTYKMELEAGSEVLTAEQISLKFTNNKTKEESSVLLTLSDLTSSNNEDEDTLFKDGADGNEDQTGSPAKDFTTSVVAVEKADFSNVTSTSKPKADFSNVKSKATATPSARLIKKNSTKPKL